MRKFVVGAAALAAGVTAAPWLAVAYFMWEMGEPCVWVLWAGSCAS
jgi:hypothetical protein